MITTMGGSLVSAETERRGGTGFLQGRLALFFIFLDFEFELVLIAAVGV